MTDFSKMVPFYVDCPTEEIWNKVANKIFDMGYICKFGRHPLYSMQEAIDKYSKLSNNTNYETVGFGVDVDGKRRSGYFKRIEYKHIPYQTFLGIKEEPVTTIYADWAYPDCTYQTKTFIKGYSPVPLINNSLKEKAMSYLKHIPARLKRMLNTNYQAFYKLGWVDGELDITGDGKVALTNFLFDKFEKELGEVAMKEVKQLKKKEKDEE